MIYKDLLPVLALFSVVVFVGIAGEAAKPVKGKASSKGDTKTRLKTSSDEKQVAGLTQGFCGKYEWDNENTRKLKVNDGSELPPDPYRVERAAAKRITSAREADQKQFPSFALLEYKDEDKPEPNDQGRCGGAIIGRDLIVTAAKCASSYIKEIKVRAGLNWDGKLDAGQEGPYYNKWMDAYKRSVQQTVVSKRCIHKKYESDKNYDVAVLKTKDLFQWTEFVQPACLLLDTKPNRYGYYMVNMGKKQDYVWSEKLRFAPVAKNGGPLDQPAQWPQTVFRPTDEPHQHWPTKICDGDEGGPVYSVRKNIQSLVAITSRVIDYDRFPGCGRATMVTPTYYYDVYKDPEGLKELIAECSK